MHHMHEKHKCTACDQHRAKQKFDCAGFWALNSSSVCSDQNRLLSSTDKTEMMSSLWLIQLQSPSCSVPTHTHTYTCCGRFLPGWTLLKEPLENTMRELDKPKDLAHNGSEDHNPEVITPQRRRTKSLSETF